MTTPACHLCGANPATFDEFGDAFACVPCQDAKKENNRIKRLSEKWPAWIAQSGIPLRHQKGDWNKVRPLEPNKGLYLFGPVGCGKTHHIASLAIAGFWSGNANSVFVTMQDLLEEAKDAFHDEAKQNPVRRYLEIGTLYLDDLGVELDTDWAVNVIGRIINHRYNWMLPTVITSNLDLDEIARKIDERVASRIAEMCTVLKMSGEDRRVIR